MVMVIFMTLSMGGSRTAAAQNYDLSQYLWKNRLLLLFAPHRSHPLFDSLHRSVATRKAEVSDRDLVVFEIFDSDPSRVNNAPIGSETARLLREKFSVDREEFNVILIGKDGGVKLNRNDQTNLNEIFALIDSMPMRREEMRQKSQ
jgi:hypothetical protein